jgi:hypothetical protein
MRGLRQMIVVCQHEIDILKKMMYASREQQLAYNPKFEQIQTLIDGLYNLPYSGPILRQQIQMIRQSYDAVAHRYETAFARPVNGTFIDRIKSFGKSIFD